MNFSVFIKILDNYFNLVQSFEFLYHRVMKEKKILWGNEYGQKQVIKTAINVLPIFIVPLVVERKKIKSHPDVQKLRMQLHMLHIR